jgi:3-oxoacyl-[acyl-carrier protein] reductase
VVRALAADGAAVVFSYVSNEGAAREVESAVGAEGGSASAVQAELGQVDSVRGLFAQAEEALGGLDIVVLNASVIVGGTIAEVQEADYDRVMNTNAKGTFFAMQEAARRVRDGGRIIAISSLNTVLPVAGNVLYSASKGAVEQFVAIAARELAPRQITVNAVSPGAIDTDLLRSANTEEDIAEMIRLTPLGRLGTPADIADVVAFLAGPRGRWMTGENLRAGGGVSW